MHLRLKWNLINKNCHRKVFVKFIDNETTIHRQKFTLNYIIYFKT